MSKSETSNNIKLILPHQQVAFERLAAIARVCFLVNRNQFPLSIRTNVCLIGSSGYGKTHLAKSVADSMEVPFLSITSSEWMVLGSSHRGSKPTWPRIHEFLVNNSNKTGSIILIDELDKLYGNAEWTTFARTEIYMLLDGSVPSSLVDGDGDSISEMSLAESRQFLKNKTLIIGAGAFQGTWDDRARPGLGFVPDTGRGADPDLHDLVKTLPREFINRFGSNLIILHPLEETEYHQILDAFANVMPDFWKPRFIKLGREGIPEAARLRLGVRYFEELGLEMLLTERREIASFRKEEPAHPANPVEPEDDDLNLQIF